MIDFYGYRIFDNKEEFLKKYNKERGRYDGTSVWWGSGFDESVLEKDEFYPFALYLYVPSDYYDCCRYYLSSIEEATSSMLEKCETDLRSICCRQKLITNWLAKYQNKK